jgi:formimidoylglutamate deiminase
VSEISFPALVNAHSHAFQFALVGHSETLGEDFWAWRKSMYRLALGLEPQDLEAIAQICYKHMRLGGYNHVVEFHYLHNDPKGSPYSDRTVMAKALLEAAQNAGIGITLVPVFYRTRGFDGQLDPKQRRFIFKDPEDYLSYVEDIRQLQKSFTFELGWGLHSLRAATIEHTQELLAAGLPGPFHIHISEQPQEVSDCIRYRKFRPVEWLLNQDSLPANLNLIHAIHLDEGEKRLVQDHCIVSCPSTEANLGDGLFNFDIATQKGLAIGTDSQVNCDVFEELRLLKIFPRLLRQKRWIEGCKAEDLLNLLDRSGLATAGLCKPLKPLTLKHASLEGLNPSQALEWAILKAKSDWIQGCEVSPPDPRDFQLLRTITAHFL